jgi:hypothetical protein
LFADRLSTLLKHSSESSARSTDEEIPSDARKLQLVGKAVE